MAEEKYGKASLLNEINIMKKLNHENIVKLLRIYETEKSVYLIIDLVKGKILMNNYYKK